MSDTGWIALYRSMRENWIWDIKPYDKTHAWLDLILSANHQSKKITLGNELIDVERGSFITSELKLMERWGWSKSKVRAFLQVLQNEKMIVKKTDNKKTAIFVLNYDKYQNIQTDKEPQKDHKKTTKRPQKDTNNNENNENNENNDISNKPIGFVPPSINEVKEYCDERGKGVNPERFIDFYESKGWMIGKNKMKNWKAAVRTWECKNDSVNKNTVERKYEGGDIVG